MTKSKGTKRALLSSVVALFLCFSMLLGTTFAWFTDTVTSAGNVIQSGTLDVDLVDAAGNSLAGDVIEFVTADDRDQDEILWEPGCTYNMENVYVKNNGTLALKYEIVINGINGDAKLLEAIEWTVTVNGVETDLADLKGSLLPAGATSDAIVLSGNTEDGIVNNIVYFDAVAKASSADELQAALNATGNVVVQLTNDIEGDVNIVSAADKKVIIDGGNNDFAGVITIDGKSATYTTAGFTIKNVNFVADSISADACIQLGDGTIATRYTCNVTVENCTFDVPGAVGVKSYTGGDKNLVIRDCTATANAHSLVQAKGIDGVLVENCKVYSKNGLNFNNSDNVTVVGCTVDVKGYAVRFGESSGGSGAAETYLIKDCSLTSANDDGDATIILRGTADNSTLTIENTTIFGTPDIANTAANATVIK